MNYFTQVGFFIFLIFIMAWLESRGSLRTPASLTEAVKHSALGTLLYGAVIIVPEAVNGTLTEHGPGLLLFVLAFFAIGIGIDWLRLRRSWAETDQ